MSESAVAKSKNSIGFYLAVATVVLVLLIILGKRLGYYPPSLEVLTGDDYTQVLIHQPLDWMPADADLIESIDVDQFVAYKMSVFDIAKKKGHIIIDYTDVARVEDKEKLDHIQPGMFGTENEAKEFFGESFFAK